MKLKEKIYTAINQMNMNELILLYEHIRLLTEMKQAFNKKRVDVTIEEVLEITASSVTSWSDTVIEERADRI